MKLTLAAAYVATVVLANILTERIGLVPIGLGLAVTAGTFAAGAALLLRNALQDYTRRRVIVALMLAGAVLSWWLASPALAVASGAAFLLSESADMAVFTPLRARGWSRAALAAATAGALVDTFVFLGIAGFPITSGTVAGQLVVKIGVSALAVVARGGLRAVFR